MARLRVGSTVVHEAADRCTWCTELCKNALICAKCKKRIAARESAWRDQHYSRVQVLTETAAEIARATFSKTQLRDYFEFVADGPEQWQFGVWREGRQWAGGVHTRSGRYVSLHERFDTWVPFTLATDKYALKYSERFWGGVRKLAKAAGAL